MIQVFDVDRSLSVLGGKKEVQSIFGLDPISISTDYKVRVEYDDGRKVLKAGPDEHLKALLNRLFIKERVKVKNELLGIETDEIILSTTEQAKALGLKGIIVDTLSGLGEGVRNHLVEEGKFDQMTMDLWGKYSVRISSLINILKELPTQVLLTCHVDRLENDQGVQIEYPAIKGGQKTDALRWFDVIVFHHVVGNRVFWQVAKDEKRPFIRTRQVIPEWEDQVHVEMDYLPVLRAYKKSATPLKMLVCGDSGTGKTSAFKTLKPYVDAIRKAKGRSTGRRNTDDKSEQGPDSAQPPDAQ